MLALTLPPPATAGEGTLRIIELDDFVARCIRPLYWTKVRVSGKLHKRLQTKLSQSSLRFGRP
jgi:hypothetical protein